MAVPKFVLTILAAATVLVAPSLAEANKTEAHSRAYGPRNTVHVSKPTLRWEVWPGRGSDVTDALMTINGKTVSAKYNTKEKVLEYTPSQPLPAGDYKVFAKVMVDRRLPVERAWEFEIVPNALRELPQPNRLQSAAIAKVNSYRRLLGLPELESDDRLSAAAQKHSEYLAANNRTGHYQKRGEKHFVGEQPGDRLDAFGYSDDSWEGVDYGGETPEIAVERLFDAPYHRIPFMQPGHNIVGAGFSDERTTLEFGMNHQAGTVVSPADGQRNVPTTWHGRERPDPMRLHGLKAPIGYPIVFAHFTGDGSKIKVKKASLRTALGREVKIGLNTPANDDHLGFASFLLPFTPLEPNTGYTVSVEAYTASGLNVSKTWKFVTAAR